MAKPKKPKPLRDPHPEHLRVIDEALQGQRSVIAIDDTGDPEEVAVHATEMRVGVVISAPLVPPVLEEMTWLRADLKENTAEALHHFHMRTFHRSSLNLDERLRYMRALVGILLRYKLPVVVADRSLVRAALYEGSRAKPHSGPGGLWLPRDLWQKAGLQAELRVVRQAVTLCPDEFPVSAWLASTEEKQQGRAFGQSLRYPHRPEGRGTRLNLFPERLDPRGFIYEDARSVVPLQLADFAAWSTHRLASVVKHGRPELLSVAQRRMAEALFPLIGVSVNGWPEEAFRVFEGIERLNTQDP